MSVTSIYDLEATEAFRKLQGLDPGQIRKLRTSLCKRFVEDSEISERFSFSDAMRLHWLEVNKQCDSSLDGATKLLMQTDRGMLIETVILRIATGRTTLCVSSQVGCAAACDFCATGKMGVAQNLSCGEILDQVVLAGQLLAKEERKIRNIVFMGMGEPFHNEAGLFDALRTLVSTQMFCHPPTRILVSSVGVVDGMVRCAEEFPEINQALSLHSVDQDVREKLIPLAKKYPLSALREAIEKMNRLQSCPVMIEYLMIAGMNDSQDCAQRLIDWLVGLNVHVNLIPYNPIDAAPNLIGSSKASIDAFAATLKSSGLDTTTRYSLGKDIAAACGQLVQQENRRIAQSLSLG